MKGKISPRAAKSAHKAQLSDIQKALKAYYQKANVLFPGEKRLQNGNNVIDLRLLPPNKANPGLDQIESSMVSGQQAVKVPLISLFTGANEKRVLVTGRAGIGKTILCDHLVNEWCNGSLLSNFQVVFRLRLKTLASKKPANLIEWIKSECFSSLTCPSDDAIKQCLLNHSGQTLFILDGFDEALALYKNGGPLKDILEEVLRYENVFTTARPFCRAELMLFGFDRVLENVGFDDTTLKEYLNTFDKKVKLNLWSVVQQQPVLKRICRIPLNAFLFASTWEKDAKNQSSSDKLTLTGIYQRFILNTWKTRNDKSLKTFGALKKKYPSTFKQLAKLAFTLSTDKDGRLIATSDELDSYEIELEKTGMLRYVDDGEAMFVHKTFQEFFAAYHLYLELLRKPHKKKATHAIDFIRSNKYQSRYEMELTFLVGLVFSSTKKKPSKSLLRARNVLWDALFPIERDLIGPHHSQLLIRSLEESGRDCKVHIDELVEWLEASLSEDPLSEMLRQRLREAFELCPRTTQRVFQAYQEKLKVKDSAALWAKLTDNQRQVLLQDYWLPLLSHFEGVPSFLIDLLADEKLPKEQLQMVLSVDWREAKNSRQRQQLSEQLSKHVMNLSGDQQLVCFQVWCALLTEEDTFAVDVIENIEIKKKSDPLALCALFSTVVLIPEFQINALSLLCEQVVAEDEFAGMLLAYTRDWNGGKDLKVDAWLKCLSSKNDRLRDVAIRELSGLLQKKDKGYEELQTSLLSQETLEGKGERPPLWDERVDTLLEALNSANGTIRSAAIKIAGNIAGSMKLKCPNKVIEKLRTMMITESCKGNRINVIEALVQVVRWVDFTQVKESLLVALKGESEEGRISAAEALGMLPVLDDQDIKPLLVALKDKSEKVRLRAVESLGIQGGADGRVNGALLVAMNDKSDAVGQSAAKALEAILHTPARMVSELLVKLQHDDYYVRRRAVVALGMLGVRFASEQVISGLLKALKEEGTDLPGHAAEALGKVGVFDDRVIPALLRLLHNKAFPRVLSHVVFALEKVGVADARVISGLLKALKESKDKNVRHHVVRALGKVGVNNKRVVQSLLETLESEPFEVYSYVADVLVELSASDDRVIPALLFNLQNAGRALGVRRDIADALRKLGVVDNAIISALLKVLKEDKDSEVRGNVAVALGRLGGIDPSNVKLALLEVFNKDIEIYVRLCAAIALGKIGGLDQKELKALTTELLKSLKNNKKDNDATYVILKALKTLYADVPIPSWLYSSLKDSYLKCQDNTVCSIFLALIADPMHSIHYEIEKKCSQLNVTLTIAELVEPYAEVKALYQQLDEYQQKNKGKFLTYLLAAFDQLQLPPVSASSICQTLNIPLEKLINAVVDRKEQSHTVFLALAEYWLLNGADLQRRGWSAFKSTILDKEITQEKFVQPYLKALRERMVAHGWPHRRIDSHLNSQLPRFFQQSRCVFYPPNDPLPLIPLITRNQAHVKGESSSFQEKVSNLFDLQVFDVDGDDQPYFTVQKNGDAIRIQFKRRAPCFMLLRKNEKPPADLIPNSFYFSWESYFSSSREFMCHIKCLDGEIKHFQVKPGKFLDWIRKVSEPKAVMKSVKPGKSLQNDFLAAHDLVPPTAKAIMESIVDMIVKQDCCKLDLSGNNLDDVAIRPLIKCLLNYKKLRVLKLSNNRITLNGFNQLIECLEKSPSVQYLLLDHNLIHFGADYCDELLGNEYSSRIKDAGLGHLDLSMNFIPKGELINGKELADKKTLKALKLKPDICCETIANDLIVHSECYDPVVSIIAKKRTAPVMLLHDNQSRVGLFSYRGKLIKSIGTHSMLIIERVVPGFGQRQLIRADLVYDSKNDDAIVKVSVITPEEFYEKFGGVEFEKVFWRSALANSGQIDKLLDAIYKSRNREDFNKFATIPSNDAHVMNCHKWAVNRLCDVGIIPESYRNDWLIKEDKKLTRQVVFESTLGRFS